MRSHPYSVAAQPQKTMGSSLDDLAQIKVVVREPSALKKTLPMRLVSLPERAVANKNPPPRSGEGSILSNSSCQGALGTWLFNPSGGY